MWQSGGKDDYFDVIDQSSVGKSAIVHVRYTNVNHALGKVALMLIMRV